MTITDDRPTARPTPAAPPSFIRRHPILAGFGVLSALSLFSALWPASAIVIPVAIAGDATELDRAIVPRRGRMPPGSTRRAGPGHRSRDRCALSVRHRSPRLPPPRPDGTRRRRRRRAARSRREPHRAWAHTVSATPSPCLRPRRPARRAAILGWGHFSPPSASFAEPAGMSLLSQEHHRFDDADRWGAPRIATYRTRNASRGSSPAASATARICSSRTSCVEPAR